MPWPSEQPAQGAVHLVPSAPEMTEGFEALPQPLTSLVGREQTSAEVAAMLRRDDVRLLTLTGPGGMGKTRLALRVAADLAADFPDGIVFAALAPLADPDLVLPTIAQAVGMQGSGTQPLAERLSRALKDQRMLVVLDNFEQVSAAATRVAAVLAANRNIKFLVTSRAPLRVSGEQEVAVPPLALPENHTASAAELAANPAVALFVQRARAVKSDFVLDASNARPVADICRRLKGVPLAIELAAARSKVLPPPALLARLSHSLDILSGGPVDQPARHRTMRAAIHWSYDLLPPDQQSLLRTLSVFAGGFSLDAAEYVARPDPAQRGSSYPLATLDSISALTDANLLGQETSHEGEPRFMLLETIRQFALERLEASDEAGAVIDRFVEWCIALANQASVAFTGSGPGIWSQRLAMEIDNMRSALGMLASRGESERLLRLATALAPLWTALGNEREGYDWLTATIERCDGGSSLVCMRAIVLAARLANSLGDLDAATTLAQRGLALASAAGDAAGIADARCVLGNIARGLGKQEEARSRYEDALSRYRELGDRYNMGYTLVQLAKLGDLGSVDHPGDPADQARAQEQCEEAIRLFQELGNSWGMSRAMHQLAYVTYKKRDYLPAARLSGEALVMFWEHGDLTEVASCFEDLADIAGMLAHAETAARLYGAAEALRERLGVPMWPSYREEYEREVAITRNVLPQDRFRTEWQAGRALALPAAVAEALDFVEQLGSHTAIRTDAGFSDDPGSQYGLTSREMEVVRLIAAGNSNQAIADALFISVTTVKGHVRSILSKLELDSRTAVAAWAHQHGMV